MELNPEAFATDVAEFEQALRLAAQAPDEARKVQHLAAAVERYGGPLLPGFYEDWVLNEQSRLAERFVHAVRQLLALLPKQGETARALELARQAIAVDPLREDLHAELMRLLADSGQPAAALRQYRDLERLLHQELGEPPGPPLQRLARQLEEQQLLRGGAEPVALPARPRASTPVPTLPSGTVTFLLTDIEGSTGRWEREGEAFRVALGLHHALLRREFQRHEGREAKEAGDSFVAAFASAGDALACAVAAQRALAGQEWPAGVEPLRVRMALHSGDVELSEGEYRGLALHRAARILAAAHGGQALCSEATFALLRRDLETEVRLRELGVYRLRDVEAAERLFQVEHPGAAQAAFPPLNAPRAEGGSLPVQVTRFFGRERELLALAALLGPPAGEGSEARLLTLTGPGGNGKTRLAVEVARQLVEPYAGAVWFVPLADLDDPALLPATLLAALRLEPAAGAPLLQQAAAFLRARPSLLILDNFEQLLGAPGEENVATAAVRTLLEEVGGLVALVTSRQVLGLPGEREFPVAPLPTPARPAPSTRAAAEPVTPHGLTLYESVRLFVDRAQAVKPDFQVTNGNAPAVAELCSRLEGIPLAIELAAARAQVLTPAQMLQQLAGSPGGRFDLLVSRKRGLAERQRALRATVDWSYRLLSPALQDFFQRLCVFRGGWSVEAAEAVCEEGAPALSGLALDHLAQLRECSLVQTLEDERGIRFCMLETLREYACERLEESGAAPALRQRHRDYFLGLSETAEAELRGPDQATWLDRLDAEHENLRAAFQGALRGLPAGVLPEPEAAAPLRFCAALWYFWSIRGHLAEGRRLLDRVLAAVPADDPRWGRSALRARALAAAGALAHDQSDYAAASERLEESIALWRTLAGRPGDDGERGLAHALNCLANVRLDQDRPDEAMALYQEALGLAREVGDSRVASMALSNLGVLHLERGDLDRAADLLAESVRLKRRLGNPYGLAMSLESLGNLERSRKHADRARALCEEALALRRGLGHRLGIAMSLNNLGHLLLESGEHAAAEAHLRESLALFEELGEPRAVLESLTGLGGVAAETGDPERAARLLGAAAAGREARGFSPSACEQRVIRRCHAAAEQALGPDRFAAAYERGRALTPEEVARAVDARSNCRALDMGGSAP